MASSGDRGAAAIRLEESRRAHARGWALTPLVGKRPTQKGWTEAPKPSIQNVEAWARSGNVGVRTGAISGIVVIDVDEAKGGSVAELALPRTATMNTGGGGRHFYFAAPAEAVGNSVGTLGPHIDVRGDGGQVVFAGSVHPETGRVYLWADGLSPDEVEIQALPEPIIARLRGPKPAASSERKVSREQSRLVRYAETALDGECDAVRAAPEGTRNNRLNVAAFKVGRFVGASLIDRPAAEDRLAAAAREAGLDRSEAIATIGSGLAAGAEEPHDVIELAGRLQGRSGSVGSVGPVSGASAVPDDPGPTGSVGGRGEPSAGGFVAARSSNGGSVGGVGVVGDVSAAASLRSLPQYRPFPLHALPEPLRSFASESAESIGCDPAFVALPSIVVAGASIGTTHVVRLKGGWREFPIVWATPVAPPSSAKSPAQDCALWSLRRRQIRALREYRRAMDKYLAEHSAYEGELTEWKREGRKDGTPCPKRPPRPVLYHAFTDDITVEALAERLENQPRGVLVARDESSGWIAGFDAYKKAKGADAAHWLNMFGGRPIKVDRKTGDRTTIYVPCAAVWVVGGIQPRILRARLGREHRDNGLASRLLVAMPPDRPRQWTDAEVSKATAQRYDRMLEALAGLELETDEDGAPHPIEVVLSADAKAIWVRFFNEHGIEQLELDDDLRAVWGKLEAYASRVALIHHMARWADGDPQLRSPVEIDGASMEAAVELARWFGSEARRVYTVLSDTEEHSVVRGLLAQIDRRGGRVRVRDWQRAHSLRLRTAQEAERELDQLVRAHLGAWDWEPPGPKGGRPSRVFRRTLTADTDTTDETPSDGAAPKVLGSDGPVVSDDPRGEGPLLL